MIRIGSRGSQLALWQANHIAGALRGRGHQVSIEIIRTSGDRMQSLPPVPPAGKGLFTKEIEEALLAGAIDLAVHSLKDLPTELSASFALAAIPERVDPRDVLVSKQYGSLVELPQGAVVGTGSLRRRAQLHGLRPDLRFIEFRGNVDTRLEKLARGGADAIILAAAGLDRLDRAAWVRERFAPAVLCPAPGQGALAVECRAEDAAMRAALEPLDHSQTRAAVTAERSLLAALGGGCQVPIGAYCYPADVPVETGAGRGKFLLQAVVASPGGEEMLRGEIGPADPLILGEELAHQLLERGAAAILGLETNGVWQATDR